MLCSLASPHEAAYCKVGCAPCRWCAPYGYKERANLGCGGADKCELLAWRVIAVRCAALA